MKCPKCDGRGYVYNALGSFNEDCGHCQGTGKVRAIGEPMTNEEFLRSTTTEELAGTIYEWFTLGFTRGKNGKKLNPITEVVEWLTEIHDDNA